MFESMLVMLSVGVITPPTNLAMEGRVTSTGNVNQLTWADKPIYPKLEDIVTMEVFLAEPGQPFIGGSAAISIGNWNRIAGAGYYFDASNPVWSDISVAGGTPSAGCTIWPDAFLGECAIPWDGTPVAELWMQGDYVVRFSVATTSRIVGDSDLDGQFNSSDVVAVFQLAEYEDGLVRNSSFVTGDWDANREFDSGDFIVAFQIGQYEQTFAASTIPEPSSATMILSTVLSLIVIRSRGRSFRSRWAQ